MKWPWLETYRSIRIPTAGALKFPNILEKLSPLGNELSFNANVSYRLSIMPAMKTPFYTQNGEVCARALVGAW